MSRNIDLRVLKTKKLIKDSFLALITEKGFENITINDISNKAQINRSTFYLHYTDKYDLLDKTVKETFEKLLGFVSPETHIKEGKLELESFSECLNSVLRAISADSQFYKTMLSNNSMITIKENMVNIFKHKFDDSFHINTSIPKELFIELIASLYVGAITWWLDNDMVCSSSYMAQQIIKLFTTGPIKLIQLKNERVNLF